MIHRSITSHRGHVLVLDVGTTGIKALVFDGRCRLIGKAYRTIKKMRPKRGWVEQDPKEIVAGSVAVLREVVRDAHISVASIRGMGITNQREASVLWDRETGKTVYPVIGWEDTRTMRVCDRVRTTSGAFVAQATGLPVLPYFSASKIQWMLEHVPLARRLLKEGRLVFGTLDSWLLWNLCDVHPHVTDETNVSRTLLYHLRDRVWNNRLLKLFEIPSQILPSVNPSRAVFGKLDPKILNRRIPILAMCGDQQASTYAAMRATDPSPSSVTKVTYGTGVFIAQTLGSRFALHPPFITTLAPSPTGSTFIVEGKIEGSGEAVTRLLKRPAELDAYLIQLARRVDRLLRQLPKKPRQLIIDGGIARTGRMAEIQEQISGIPCLSQDPYDGTGLGTALLVWDSMEH